MNGFERTGHWARLWLLALLAQYPTSDARGQPKKLETAIESVVAENKALAKSQEQLAEVSDQTQALLEEYRRVRRRIHSLRTYNAQLQALLVSQQKELDSLREQIDKVSLVGREIRPLMLRMIEALDRFVALDLPFLMEERRKRVAELRQLMKRADVEESERFRRLLEAYQIENEYGRTIGAYRGTLELEGSRRTVDFLRLGRVALLYQTLDRQQVGHWDRKSKSWKKLPQEYVSEVSKGLRMARKQAAPDLLRLPVPAPRDVEGRP